MAKKHKKKKELGSDLEIEDIPFVGGLLKGIEKLVDLAERVEEAGGKIERRGKIKGLKKDIEGIYGFSVKTGIGGKPKVQTFGNVKRTIPPSLKLRRTSKERKKVKPGFKITETREPIVDIFDEKDHVLIVAELPGVAEESIKLDLHPVKSRKAGAAKPQFNRVKGDILTLEAGDEKRKYSKEILLPSRVKFEKREQSFKNGVLEIKIPKK